MIFNIIATVDAFDLTYDPDIADSKNKTGISYQWMCKRSNETWPASIANLSAHVFSGNEGGCFGDGPGMITNYTNLTLNLNTSLFLPRLNYTLRLEIQKDIRRASYDLTLYISKIRFVYQS